MHRRLAWMPALLATLPLAAFASSSVVHDRAEVRQLGTGRLLYRESHYLPGDSPGERWVLYLCPDGTPFARKRVTASTQPMAPNFRLEDGRDGYREGVRGGDGQRVVYAGNGAGDARALPLPIDGVIDAGFDEAIRRHWDALQRGEAVSLRFLVPSRKQFFPVRVQRVDTGEGTRPRTMALRMRLATWFGFAVPDVQLVYRIEDRRLLVFSGTGNVGDARNRYPQVRIAFSPRPETASTDELARMQREPLSGRCAF